MNQFCQPLRKKQWVSCETRNRFDEADRETLQCGIKGSKPNSILITNVLIDTVTLQANYVSEAAATWLKSQGFKSSNETNNVCGIAGRIPINSYVVFNLQLPTRLGDILIINIKCYILPDSNYDIILGRPDINKYQISDKVILLLITHGWPSRPAIVVGPSALWCAG